MLSRMFPAHTHSLPFLMPLSIHVAVTPVTAIKMPVTATHLHHEAQDGTSQDAPQTRFDYETEVYFLLLKISR